jgi:hypothetical protein
MGANGRRRCDDPLETSRFGMSDGKTTGAALAMYSGRARANAEQYAAPSERHVVFRALM